MNVLKLHQSRSLRNLKDDIKGKTSFGRPKRRWLDDVENDLKKLGARRWRKTTKDRDVWKLIMKEVRVQHRPYSQYRRKYINTILYYYTIIILYYITVVLKMYVTDEQNILHKTHLAYKKFCMSCKSYCENSVFESDCIAYMNTYK
jgi:hypothetical protein